MGKPAIEAHRLAGNSFGVRLFSEKLFDTFATSASADYLVPNSYLENMDCWEKLTEIRKNFPTLEDLLAFLNSHANLQRIVDDSCRDGVYTAKRNDWGGWLVGHGDSTLPTGACLTQRPTTTPTTRH